MNASIISDPQKSTQLNAFVIPRRRPRTDILKIYALGDQTSSARSWEGCENRAQKWLPLSRVWSLYWFVLDVPNPNVFISQDSFSFPHLGGTQSPCCNKGGTQFPLRRYTFRKCTIDAIRHQPRHCIASLPLCRKSQPLKQSQFDQTVGCLRHCSLEASTSVILPQINGLQADDAERAMTIDPGGGTERMVDLEGWGSNLPVAGRGLDKLGIRTLLGRLESLVGAVGPESFSSNASITSDPQIIRTNQRL